MFQEFYKDTLINRFIKRLLRSTKLPLWSLAYDGDHIVRGIKYIYKNSIIRCTKSGNLVDSGAEYEILEKHLGFNDQNTYNYHSKVMYYDSETHIQLGNYLRYLKHQTGLNLLPFYNCYANKTISDLQLVGDADKKYYINESSSRYKLLAAPVKFGKTYTIALDSTVPISTRVIVYNADCGMIAKSNDAVTDDTIQYYSDNSELTDTYKVYVNSQFHKPFTVTIPTAGDDAQLMQHERNLYLVIQVPADNDSSLAVLEGDYHTAWAKVYSNTGEAPEEEFDNLAYRNLALLRFNTHKSYAFSERLVEHLLHNPVTQLTEIDNNIKYAYELLRKHNPNLVEELSWTADLRRELIAQSLDIAKFNFMYDIDGYLNKDIEAYLAFKKIK